MSATATAEGVPTARGGRLAGRVLDLNADVGEGFGVYRHGADAELAPLLTAANAACGGHAGDPVVMRDTAALAVRHGLALGAHVGLADREGFGRREVATTPAEAHALVVAQVGALAAAAAVAGTRLHHVKPHGALYMMASRDAALAEAVAAAVDDLTPLTGRLALYALPGCALALAGRRRGLRVVPELFADRPYRGNDVVMFGWRPEQLGGPEGCARAVVDRLLDPSFTHVRTVCVHSDTPGAPAVLAAVRARLVQEGAVLRAPIPTGASDHPDPRREDADA